jgi:malate synthase
MELYGDFLSPKLKEYLLKDATSFPGIEGLQQIGAAGGLENKESMQFLIDLFLSLRPKLESVLHQRVLDRNFLDERCKALYQFNNEINTSFDHEDYQTVLGLEDQNGRVVAGPLRRNYWKTTSEKAIADLPEYLRGVHVTLFGPPDNAKMCVNAMNAYHRRLKSEAPIVSELLATHTSLPKWGADDEDSKTPMREDLQSAGENLSRCFTRDLAFEENSKKYELAADHLSLPIKRFPGLALPCAFLFYNSAPFPLHLYDFALHLYRNWNIPEALVFYVPKLENEEEAKYIHEMIETAEKKIQQLHPEYKLGTVRLMIVLENPRAIFRTHEIMDALYPYFAGASLGWHDFLASTARLFKEDGNYRIPIKADPDIVIKYIKASHELLANVVGERGGIKVGGMYGILPLGAEASSESFQLTMKGYIRDVVTQLKRKLSGFWVAHPDFVRLGLAFVEAWKIYQEGNKEKLVTLVNSLLAPKYQKEVHDFMFGPDIEGLNPENSRYARSLIVADLPASKSPANSDLAEIRYNVFQSLQYLTDWLSGNGCVALPAQIAGVSVRVMDDLATAERSRWEVWHEIYHGRVSLPDFLKVAHEEMAFIRKDLSNESKIVQVKWNERSAKWYPVAFNLMLKLMTDPRPAEFATELLLPFTLEMVRSSNDPWVLVQSIDEEKFKLPERVTKFNKYFEACGNAAWANDLTRSIDFDSGHAESLVRDFTKKDVQEAAFFHGDIGESKKTLDPKAAGEQSKVSDGSAAIKDELLELGKKYRETFGFKFLISAEGKSAEEMLAAVKSRLKNTESAELDNARTALWEIAKKRLRGTSTLKEQFEALRVKHRIVGAQLALSNENAVLQNICLGESSAGTAVNSQTFFELASLSKTLACTFAIDYFAKKEIPLSTPVNSLLAKTRSNFRIQAADNVAPNAGDRVTLEDLMNHTALNMHYVNGVPANLPMPPIENWLGNEANGKLNPRAISEPGKKFQYSGGGYIVLEHLIASMEGKKIHDVAEPFLISTTKNALSFKQENLTEHVYAHGYKSDGNSVDGTRYMFPAFAAGAMGTAEGMMQFLIQLGKAYTFPNSAERISHDTAALMLHGKNKGSVEFMGASMGLGVFVAEAGSNRFAIHQGANDGFRCLYLYCYRGPDYGKGIVVLANGELNAVQFISEVAQIFLKELNFSGIDFEKFSSQFDSTSMKQEEVVNRGYKERVFSAFRDDLPERIERRGALDPLWKFNKVIDAQIVSCTNQKFARAENLIDRHEPTFEPDLFGAQGKVMDSWESARHSENESEDLILKLKSPTEINYIAFSTKFHLGNQVPSVSLEGRVEADAEWTEILTRTNLQGHALLKIKSPDLKEKKFTFLRIRTYPDGGLSRIYIYDDGLPQSEKAKFTKKPMSEVFPEPIPKTKKPLSIPLGPNKTSSQNSKELKVLSVSNEHYGPVAQVLSPFPPLNMFDGFESARSREPNHFEELHLKLGQPDKIKKIALNFKYFVNNNPRSIRVDALTQSGWHELVPLTNVKAFAGNEKIFQIASTQIISELKFFIYPDGGINRIKIF